MFFATYLRRELSRRMRQAIFIALGLALGVGLVVTVAAASAGYQNAELDVLSGLYGVGTDVVVVGATVKPELSGPLASGKIPAGVAILEQGQAGWENCTSAGCTNVDGTTEDDLNSPYGGISASKVALAARLHGVAAAAGGLSLLDQWQTFPKTGTAAPQSGSYSVDGVDTADLSLGPLSGGTITVGRSFTAADADAAVAIVDSGYAKANSLKVGSAVTVHQIAYTVIGIISQPQDGNPTDVYIPLAQAQAMAISTGSMTNEVNTIYLAAASAAAVPTVSKELSGLLPGTTVTTASSLASQVTRSVASAEKLLNDLGRWLSLLVLVAAFALACLLTTAAVARRAGEFGTLKALGWRSRRIVAQVLAESAAVGVAGAAAGVGLGLAGAAIIAQVAPKASAIVGANPGPPAGASPGAGRPVLTGGASLSHPVAVTVHPSVSAALIILAVVLAIAGGLLAGAFASWRIAVLRPADALARVT
jgi:putative ABC transport system permease protein